MTWFYATKTYGHEVGLSCCFRQWRAKSHCSQLHGYALAIMLEFSTEDRDENGWVIDFGGLKPVKQWLVDTFDHATLVAEDDPDLVMFDQLNSIGLARVVKVPATGCEAFADLIRVYVSNWLKENFPRVELERVEVREHGANAAGVIAAGE